MLYFLYLRLRPSVLFEERESTFQFCREIRILSGDGHWLTRLFSEPAI